MKLDETILKCFEELVSKANTPEYFFDEDDNEKFYEWATSVISLFQRIFNSNDIQLVNFIEQYNEFKVSPFEHEQKFKNCRGILNSAYNDYKNGYLFKVKTLISAEVLDNVIEQAEELYKNNYKEAACIIAGVALETTLRKLCEDNGIESAKMDKMNADLAKANKYNKSKQKQITAWAGLRNDAAHGDWDSANDNQVKPMIDGVNAFMADYLNP